ncbi:uncharacterized protein [Triticum aestivum]|uniref:uncharacterized protein isoform X2 n=1 Tax=Triticum aestivum TaxID=4565 RepID=UPI001D020A0F|nr:uncharacterized protein LOC123086776 isoform X2 [Triticum aestivum]
MCSYALLVHTWLCYFVMKYIYKFHLSNDADFISLILSSRGKCTWKLNKGLSSAPVTQNAIDTLALASPATSCGIPTVVSTEGKSPSSLPVLRSPSLGTTFVAPVWPTVVRSLPSRCKSTALTLLKNAGSSATLGSQMKHHRFCTLAGDQSVTNSGERYIGEDSHFQHSNSTALRERVLADTSQTATKALSFKARYKNFIRPLLVNRCLIAPCGINDPWMIFLQRQTFSILGHNPCYLSSFDITSYEDTCKDGEFETFLDLLVSRKGYIIEDWDSSFSTIEPLMYDHGLKQPYDGTNEPLYKGECDASYDNKTGIASLSYIIWKDDKIIYSEVFSDLKCSSSNEAEIHAALALLYKAEELKISKLHLWTDSRTAASVLTGELSIPWDHAHHDFFLTLRGMRKRFSRLVVTWRPREMLFFPDELAEIAKSPGCDLRASHTTALEKWSGHLRGLPVHHIEWTNKTATAVRKFKNKILDEELYGMSGPDVYFVEVEECRKLDCLVVLK